MLCQLEGWEEAVRNSHFQAWVALYRSIQRALCPARKQPSVCSGEDAHTGWVQSSFCLQQPDSHSVADRQCVGCTCMAMQAPGAAVGFRVAVQKWLALVRLLLGEIPERTGGGRQAGWGRRAWSLRWFRPARTLVPSLPAFASFLSPAL